MYRILAIVEKILSVIAMKVTPGDPFQFAAPDFGIRVEDPSKDLSEGDTFTPSLVDLLSKVMNGTATNLPPAMVNISSNLLNDATGSIPRISATIYGHDALFQGRPRFAARVNHEVRSSIIDISLWLNGSMKPILCPRNSNVVKITFTKTMVNL